MEAAECGALPRVSASVFVICRGTNDSAADSDFLPGFEFTPLQKTPP